MQFLKRIFQFYIHSSIHVALAVVAFTILRIRELGLQLQFSLLAFVFVATISGYNFVKYASIAKLYHRRLTKQLQAIQLFSALAFILMLYLLFQLKAESVLLLIGLALINFIYAYPVFSNGKNLRNLSGVKIFVIALVWASTNVLLPVFEYELALTNLLFWQFIQQMLMVVALMIPFEIRDFRFDHQRLQTLPQILGIKKSKFIGIFFLIFSLVISLYIIKISLVFSIVFTILLGILIFFTHQKQYKYFASFLVEAVPIITLIIYLTLISV